VRHPPIPIIGAECKCWHGSLAAAIDVIPENICSSRAFVRLTEAVILGKISADLFFVKRCGMERDNAS